MFEQTTPDPSSPSSRAPLGYEGGPPFDPAVQNSDRDARIVAALERLARVFRLLLWEEAEPRGLSPLQIQVLVHLRHHGAALRRVGRLAEEFQVTPATVSDAVSTLASKGLVRKETSERDRRVSILELTPEGGAAADAVSGWAGAVHREVAGGRSAVSPEDREAALRFLLGLIESLQRAGVVTEARMCGTCRFFGRGEGPGDDRPHFCHLLEKPLATADLRLDCPEHEASGG